MSIIIEAFPCPLKFCQLRLPRLDGSFPGAIFLPVRFPVESEYVMPYCKGPKNESCLFQAVVESNCWLIKWPLNLWGFMSSS